MKLRKRGYINEAKIAMNRNGKPSEGSIQRAVYSFYKKIIKSITAALPEYFVAANDNKDRARSYAGAYDASASGRGKIKKDTFSWKVNINRRDRDFYVNDINASVTNEGRTRSAIFVIGPNNSYEAVVEDVVGWMTWASQQKPMGRPKVSRSVETAEKAREA